MPVILELAVADPDAAGVQLTCVFGFSLAEDVFRLGDQALRLVQRQGQTHGAVDHLALAVPDVDAAAARMMARGALRDPDVTPDGPLEIPEFWDAGVRYLFLQGPEGARIELITNRASPKGPGHDHIGIPCSDIAASAAFFAGLGATPLAEVALQRADGRTQVRFLALDHSVIELYQPPRHHPAPGQGKWHRLLIPGVAPATGPDGITVARP